MVHLLGKAARRAFGGRLKTSTTPLFNHLPDPTTSYSFRMNGLSLRGPLPSYFSYLGKGQSFHCRAMARPELAGWLLCAVRSCQAFVAASCSLQAVSGQEWQQEASGDAVLNMPILK